MNEVSKIKEVVKLYYDKPNLIIDWNKWVFEGHNEVVASWVRKIGEHHQFDIEATEIAAYLHDLAYAWTSKNDPTEETQSEEKAKELLKAEGLPYNRINFIVDGIIKGHGMHEGEEPNIVEAKVLATADALAHLMTDFYLVMCWNRYLFEKKSLEEYKGWVLKKIERDFNNKIFFEEFKVMAKPHYESLKKVFSV